MARPDGYGLLQCSRWGALAHRALHLLLDLYFACNLAPPCVLYCYFLYLITVSYTALYIYAELTVIPPHLERRRVPGLEAVSGCWDGLEWQPRPCR